MKIMVEFDSKEEFDEYMGDDGTTETGKAPRAPRGSRKKADAAAAATTPDPINPPAVIAGAGGMGFGGAGNVGGPFGGMGAVAGAVGTLPPGPSPAVVDLVNRINGRIDAAIASGQPSDGPLIWFRNACGPDAANATMDQIKQVFMFRLQEPQLLDIAKSMNA